MRPLLRGATALAVPVLAVIGLASTGEELRLGSAQETATSDLGQYHALIDAYAEGDDARSVETMLNWDVARVRRALARRNSSADPRKPWEQQRYGLAVMLHTDASLRRFSRADRLQAFAHLEIASGLLANGNAFGYEGVRLMARRWYYAVSRQLRDLETPDLAESLLVMAREWLTDDAVILFESGTLAESRATDHAWTGVTGMRRRWPSYDMTVAAVLTERKSHLDNALRWLSRANALDPRNDTIRLHLGRVYALRREDRHAERIFSELLRTDIDSATAYLAALFVGGLLERQSDLAGAADAYRTATAKFPDGQGARVALSQVLQRSGRAEEARAVLNDLLTGGARSGQDPRWWYNVEPPGVAAKRLGVLRDEVRR